MKFIKTIFHGIYFTGILLLLLLSSCIKKDDIQILEVEEFAMETMTRPVVTVRVRNDSRRTLEVLSGKFTVTSSYGRIGEVILTGTITVPKKSETSITIPMRVKVSNPLAAAALVAGNSIDTDRLRITGEAEIKAGSAKRNFTVTDAPVSQFLTIFGTKQPNRLHVDE